jgi:hypothetical protein
MKIKENYEIVALDTELTVYSKKCGFAGTVDFLGTVNAVTFELRKSRGAPTRD